MTSYKMRKGKADDKQWLYELYCQTLRPAIEATWGWDDEFQFKLFREHLKPEKFEIVLIEDKPIAGFYLVEHADHFWLEMLLIHPGYQRRGIGKRIVNQIQRRSASNNKALKLCVIRANPVRLFYEKLGFSVYDEDIAFYQMICETQVTR